MFTRITAYLDCIFTRRQIFIMALFACVLVIYLFPARYLLYQTVAPSGWHAELPLGSESYAYKFAISPDVPGLILSCGFAACFRSRNSGQDWQKIEVPAVGDLVAPPGGDGIFFLQALDLGIPYAAERRIWVSHDSGTTWKRLSPDSNIYTLEQGIYRAGSMYDIGGPALNKDISVSREFAISGDDGQTWSYPEKTPSIAEQAGWRAGSDSLHGIAPDYAAPRAWFRILFKNGQPPLLEHSNDDGQHWSTIGLIANANYSDGIPSIATTPFQPTDLCVAISRYLSAISEAPPVILASKDGGKSWTTGIAPADPSGIGGAIQQNVQIGQTGNCYVAHYYTTLSPGDTPTHQTFTVNNITTTAIWELPTDSSQLITLFKSTDFYFDFEYAQTFVFIPKCNKAPSHLTIAVHNRNLSVGGLYNDSANLLLWRAVD